MKKILTLCTLLICFANTGVYAQITLTQADFAVPGDTIWYSYDTLNTSSDLGTTSGAGKTWNFSAAANHEKGPTWFLDPLNSPVTPPSNITHVMVERSIDAVSFMNVSASGITTYQPNPAAFLGGDAFLSIKSMTFPLQYQTVTTDSTTSQVVVDASNVGLSTLFDSVRISFKVNLHSLCDGWGTLITPKGNYNSLRLKNTINITFKFFGKAKIIGNWVPIPTSSLPLPVPEQQKEVSYMWIGAGSKFVLAQANMVTDTEDQQDEFYYQTDKSVSSGLADVTKSNLSASVYPNPAVTETRLNFSLTTAQPITVQVYDITGKLVSISQFQCTAGNNSLPVQVGALNKGMYIVRLTGAGLEGAVKLSVIK